MEDALRALRTTDYHAVLGRDFLHLAEPASDYVEAFHAKASAMFPVGALYFEMNGFDINTDLWFFNGFAFKEAGDFWDLDWLAEWDLSEPAAHVLTGMEPVQEAFSRLHGDERQTLAVELAGELAEHLVNARYMELIEAAHEIARRRTPGLSGLPVLATAHDWDVVHVTR